MTDMETIPLTITAPSAPNPPAQPYISVSQISGSIQTAPGVAANLTLSVAGFNGWTGPVTFSSAPSPAPPLGNTTWEDPQHNYVHTNSINGFGSGIFFCTGNTNFPGSPSYSQLFAPPGPPAGLLIGAIVGTINAH